MGGNDGGEKAILNLERGDLSGPAFAQRVEAMVTAFSSMKKDPDKEKRATAKSNPDFHV